MVISFSGTGSTIEVESDGVLIARVQRRKNVASVLVDRALTRIEKSSIEDFTTGVDDCWINAKEKVIAHSPILVALEGEIRRLDDLSNRLEDAGLEDAARELDGAAGIIDNIIESQTRPKVDRAVAAFKKRASYRPVVWQTKAKSKAK